MRVLAVDDLRCGVAVREVVSEGRVGGRGGGGEGPMALSGRTL